MVGSNISLSSSLSSSSSAAALLDWSTTSAGALVVSSFSTAAHQFIQPIIRYWIGLCSVLRPRQHSILLGYMGGGFYRSKDPTNSIKVLKEKAVKNNTKNKENTKYTCIDTHKSRQIQHTSITQQVP